MPVVDTTQSFQTGDTVTSTTLNNIMDQSIFVAGAVVSGSGLAITAGGQMTTSNIPGANITNTSITGEKLANASIIPTKLSAGGPSWTTSTTLLGNAVTGTYTTNIAPARTGDGSTKLQFGSQATVSNSASIARNTGVNGTFAITNTGTGAITFSASGGVTFGTANMPKPSGTAPIFGARAWAKLNPFVGSIRTGAYKTGNYSRTATETTVTIVGHGLKTNDKIRLDFTSGTATDGLYTVTSSANANEFVVDHTGSATSGNVTAQFVAIQGSGNVSTASWYDSGDDRIVLNFTTRMPNDNYATLVTGQHYPGAFSDSGSEDTLGTTQLNTIYQGHVYHASNPRFLNVMFIG
jgi:hypothetical protein